MHSIIAASSDIGEAGTVWSAVAAIDAVLATDGATEDHSEGGTEDHSEGWTDDHSAVSLFLGRLVVDTDGPVGLAVTT
jgi:hypothetical protein